MWVILSKMKWLNISFLVYTVNGQVQQACENLESNEDFLLCREKADNSLFSCVAQCQDDLECSSRCNREYAQKLEECPCKSGCPTGCPCPNYECHSSVLALNTWMREPWFLFIYFFKKQKSLSRKSNNPPTLLHPNGDFTTTDFNFTIPPLVDVELSCSLVWKDRMFIFGGSSRRRQILEIDNCILKPVGTLQFEFRDGACTVDAYSSIYLCFSSGDDGRLCRKGSLMLSLILLLWKQAKYSSKGN